MIETDVQAKSVCSNEEFSWDREGLTDVRPVCGPGEMKSPS